MTYLDRVVLALIPARGGSKGLPGKNLRTLCGQPLLSYTIKAALSSEYIDQTWLSSDDLDILELGSQFEINLIHRPAELASDTSSASSVVEHFLSLLPKDTLAKDPFIVYLQPTSPLRSSAHINKAFSQLASSNAEFLLSVCESDRSPFKSFSLNSNGLLEPLFEEGVSNVGRQELQKTFDPNGAIYIFCASIFFKKNCFPSAGAQPYFMSQEDSVDIDTLEDFDKAATLLEKKGINDYFSYKK